MPDPQMSRMTTTSKNDPRYANTLAKQMTASSDRDPMKQSGLTHKLASSQTSSPSGSQVANFDFKKVRHFSNLYNANFGRHQPLVQEKYRLGPKKNIIQGRHLAPLKIFQDRASSLPVSKQIKKGQFTLNPDNEEYKSEISLETNRLLKNLKPVLKKNIFHSKQQVLLSLKSIEIQIIGFGNKHLTPVYVPFTQLQQVLSQPSKHDLSLNLLKSLEYQNGQFKYKPAQTKQKVSLAQTFPPIMHTSIFANGYEFHVIISMPQIEYQVNATKFCFIKPMQPADLADFYQLYFEDWDEVALTHLQSYRKFTEIMQSNAKGVHLFTESKDQNSIKHFKNREVFKEAILVAQERVQLEGCYMIKDQAALLNMKTFQVKVTGLESKTRLSYKYPLSEWKDLQKYMRKKDLLVKLEKKLMKCYNISQFSIGDIKLKKQQKQKVSKFDSQKLSTIIQKDDERYLIELKPPVAFLLMPNGDKKTAYFNEQTIKILIKGDFQNWQEQLANDYFRIELNVQSPLKDMQIITEKGQESSDDSICRLKLESREKVRVEEVRHAVDVWFGA